MPEQLNIGDKHKHDSTTVPEANAPYEVVKRSAESIFVIGSPLSCAMLGGTHTTRSTVKRRSK